MPARPPPTTTAALFTGSSNSCNGSRCADRATAMRMISFAFWVAPSFSRECTQEQCSRMLAISKKYWLIPASRQVSRKSGSWVLGVQAPSTTRFKPLAAMASEICLAFSVEQATRFSPA